MNLTNPIPHARGYILAALCLLSACAPEPPKPRDPYAIEAETVVRAWADAVNAKKPWRSHWQYPESPYTGPPFHFFGKVEIDEDETSGSWATQTVYARVFGDGKGPGNYAFVLTREPGVPGFGWSILGTYRTEGVRRMKN